MANVKFNLKSEPGERLIYLVLRHKGKKFQYSTGEKIPAKFWDREKCRARVTRSYPGARALNDMLDALERTCQDAYRDFIRDGYDQPGKASWSELRKALRTALDGVMVRGVEDIPERDFFAFVEQVIRERDASPEFSAGTVRGYRTTLNRLREFEQQWRKRITWQSIDLDFAGDLREWMYAKGLSTNYVHKVISRIRAWVNEAKERGIEVNPAYESKRFQVKQERVDDIYLTVEELAELYHLSLTEGDPKAWARDLFLLGAFTGLRFSDFTRIAPEHISQVDGNEVIQIATQKTGQRVTIPVHPFVRGILERHGGRAPRKRSNQKMNQYLKEVCKLTQWGSEPVMVMKNKGGVRVAVRREKWELVATHTARRSFATNAYKSGVPSITIMAITGHKTEKEFLRYVKVSSEEHAKIMAGNDFFRRGLFRVG